MTSISNHYLLFIDSSRTPYPSPGIKYKVLLLIFIRLEKATDFYRLSAGGMGLQLPQKWNPYLISF